MPSSISVIQQVHVCLCIHVTVCMYVCVQCQRAVKTEQLLFIVTERTPMCRASATRSPYRLPTGVCVSVCMCEREIVKEERERERGAVLVCVIMSFCFPVSS